MRRLLAKLIWSRDLMEKSTSVRTLKTIGRQDEFRDLSIAVISGVQREERTMSLLISEMYFVRANSTPCVNQALTNGIPRMPCMSIPANVTRFSPYILSKSSASLKLEHVVVLSANSITFAAGSEANHDATASRNFMHSAHEFVIFGTDTNVIALRPA
jgi:hypothetical protein